MTERDHTPTNEEIQEAQRRMRRHVESKWRPYAWCHDDWIQEATLEWLRDPTRNPATLVERRARDAHRREERRRQLREGNGSARATAETPESVAIALAGLTPRAKRGTRVSVKVKGLSLVTDRSLEPSRLRSDLELLASRFQVASNRNPESKELRDVASILWAVSDAEFDASELAGKARHWLEAKNRGPRTRTQEAEYLFRVVQRRDAEDVVRTLRILPLIASKTCIPRSGAWPEAERLEAVRKVQAVLVETIDQDPITVSKAVLRALGASGESVRNLGKHLEMRRRRGG